MEVFTTIADLWRWRTGAISPVGFVPTMGYLHAGHLSLMRQARRESSSVLVSIFVNPSQFGPDEDFQRYPRDLNHDLDLIRTTQADAVFTPSVDEMYPAGASTTVEVEVLSGILEGTSRPGHFRGVATIVCKLFHLVHPQLAFFGEKDYQQLKVIERMVHDLHMPVTVVGCPTIEEVLPVFHAFVSDTVLVAHNAAFDMRFLQLKEASTGVRFDQPVLDTLLLSAVVSPNQESHELEAIAQRLGVAVVGRHTALGDAVLAAEVFLRLVPLLAARGIETLGQARAAAQQTWFARLKY